MIAETEWLEVKRAGARMHHGGGDLHERYRSYSAASADSDRRVIASARSSGACAPEIANFPPRMKQGTPWIPASLAESASRSTSATSLSLGSAARISSGSRHDAGC